MNAFSELGVGMVMCPVSSVVHLAHSVTEQVVLFEFASSAKSWCNLHLRVETHFSSFCHQKALALDIQDRTSAKPLHIYASVKSMYLKHALGISGCWLGCKCKLLYL